MKIIQYTKDDCKAVVIAKSIGDGFRILEMYVPMEDWSTSTPFFITNGRDFLTPRVLSLESLRAVETNQRLNRRCQRAEGLIIKYRRRYVAVCKSPRLIDATKRVHSAAWAANKIYFAELYGRKCWLCRLRRFFFGK